MADYPLYCLGDGKHIAAAEWIDAKSDDEALVIARSKKHRVPCELWKGDELIAELVPDEL